MLCIIFVINIAINNLNFIRSNVGDEGNNRYNYDLNAYIYFEKITGLLRCNIEKKAKHRFVKIFRFEFLL